MQVHPSKISTIFQFDSRQLKSPACETRLPTDTINRIYKSKRYAHVTIASRSRELHSTRELDVSNALDKPRRNNATDHVIQ